MPLLANHRCRHENTRKPNRNGKAEVALESAESARSQWLYRIRRHHTSGLCPARFSEVFSSFERIHKHHSQRRRSVLGLSLYSAEGKPKQMHRHTNAQNSNHKAEAKRLQSRGNLRPQILQRQPLRTIRLLLEKRVQNSP